MPEQQSFDLPVADASGKAPLRTLPPLDSFARSDAFEFLKSLPDSSVDLVITDPPYASMELHRSKGTTTRLVGDWFSVIPNERLPELLEQVARVLKPDRHFYLFCDEITADVIKSQQRITSERDEDGGRSCACGLTYWRELIWAKTTQDETKIHGGMGYHYRSACERILFFEKGKRKLNDLGVPDVLLAPRPSYQAPAGKPLKLCRTLVEQSTDEGALVVDPFAGSGVVGLAALESKRRFLLNDLDDSYLLPEVRTVVEPRSPRFLLIAPSLKDPEALLTEMVEAASSGGVIPDDVAHDMQMLRLDTPEGEVLVRQLAQTRTVERPAILRRFIRISAWARAAMSTAAANRPLPTNVPSWLKWLEG